MTRQLKVKKKENIKIQEKNRGSHQSWLLEKLEKVFKSNWIRNNWRLVQNSPKKLGCYVHGLVMDNNTTAPANLQEDEGKDSKGCLPIQLTGIMVYANPSHQKRTWRNWFYKLAALKKKKCNVNKDKAKKMGYDIGYWIFQAKSLTFLELEEKKEVPINQWTRNHSLCGDRCYAKWAEEEGKIDAKKPLFDLNNLVNKLSVEQLKIIQDYFTSSERLK